METDVDAIWQVLLCLKEHGVEEDGEQCGGQDAPLFDGVGDRGAARQRLILFHLTSLTFMELEEDGEKFWKTANARQDFLQSITADSIKSLSQVYESCI